MPDRTGPEHPLPAIPDVASFFERFGDDAKCKAFLKETRWGANLERFICPDCGHEHGWWLPKRQLVECRDCHHQTSPTAGTILHGARVPLWKWFWAMYQEAHGKKGIAALVIKDGNEHNTMQYAEDGVNFKIASVLSLTPTAAAPFSLTSSSRLSSCQDFSDPPFSAQPLSDSSVRP